MPSLRQATTGLLALTSILVLIRSLSTMTGYNSRGLWRDSALTAAPQSTQAEVLARTRRVAAAVRHATSSPPPPPSDACLDMRRLHGVVPHVTWGTLPEAEQVRRIAPTTAPAIHHLPHPLATHQTHPCGPRCQATWSALDCDRQLDQELPQTQPEPLNKAAPLEQQHGAGDASAPPAAMAAPARNSTNSRGVPLWLEPPQTNLLFNSHAQAQVCHMGLEPLANRPQAEVCFSHLLAALDSSRRTSRPGRRCTSPLVRP